MGRLFRQLMYRQASSSVVLPLYQQILDSMPAELRTSLVCWYSPNLQGLTNVELYNSDNLYVGGLHDLSGNGHDMTLYGFDGIEGGGHVDENGNLCFDGVNDTADASLALTTDEITGFTSFACQMEGGGWTSRIYRLGNIFSIALQKNIGGEKMYGQIFGQTAGYVLNPFVGHSDDAKSSSTIQLLKAKFIYKYSIIFKRALTDTEIDWVKTNMLVSQEPSKRNVTLWLVDEESGTFDKFKTLKVQDGSMVGKYDEDGNLVLPVYDIDSIYQTSMSWYTDADCTEEYIGEYITEDTFLYTKKVRASDNMLAQLDNVVLEDGTTAREHLVCWYSPKWQGLTKESVLADATLADLSGNGYDMALNGFTEDETIIDADGALYFDGVDDYGSMMLAESEDWTYIVNIGKVKSLTSSAKYIFSFKEQSSGYGSLVEVRTTGYWYLPNNTTGNQWSQPTSERVLSCTPTSFNDLSFEGATFKASGNTMYIAKLRKSSNLYANFSLLNFVRFDKTLDANTLMKVYQLLNIN